MFSKAKGFFKKEKKANFQNDENQGLPPSRVVIAPDFFKSSESKVQMTVVRGGAIAENQDLPPAHAVPYSPGFFKKNKGNVEMSALSIDSDKLETEDSCEKKKEKSEILSELSELSSDFSLEKTEDDPITKVENWFRENKKWEKENAVEESEKRKGSSIKKFKSD